MKKPSKTTEELLFDNMRKLNSGFSKKQILNEAEEKKWIQKAGMKRGALHDRLGIPEEDTIPISVINRHIKQLEKKAEGDKKLDDDDSKFLKQLIAAKNMKELEEGESKKKLTESTQEEIYFDTLSGALDAVRTMVGKKGYTVDEDDMFTQFGTGGISYGVTKRANIGLLRDGIPQNRRNVTIVIYRMDSGKYELTAYIN